VAASELRPVADLSTTGLLWLINRTVFHPRGFALGITTDGSMWQLLGDGTEPWSFPQADDHEKFAAAIAFLAEVAGGAAAGDSE
jgi:hypothetical protein